MRLCCKLITLVYVAPLCFMKTEEDERTGPYNTEQFQCLKFPCTTVALDSKTFRDYDGDHFLAEKDRGPRRREGSKLTTTFSALKIAGTTLSQSQPQNP